MRADFVGHDRGADAFMCRIVISGFEQLASPTMLQTRCQLPTWGLASDMMNKDD